MANPRRRRLIQARRQVAEVGIGIALGAALAGCGAGVMSSPDPGVGCSVTVNIPSLGGSPLGTVRAQVGGQTYDFSRNVNTVAVACGDQATLAAAAADPAAHPFTAWLGPSGSHSGSQLTVTVTGPISLTPRFFVPRAPVATPTPKSKVTPTPSATPTTVTLDQWISYDPGTRSVTWKLVASYQGVNHGLSFDGEAFGAMQVTVPLGWSVTVDFSNAGTVIHSAAVVTATGTSTVFPGAETPNPAQGTAPGQAASFTFTASQTGSYRVACLTPGHEPAGMWASLVVSAGGLPSVHL